MFGTATQPGSVSSSVIDTADPALPIQGSAVVPLSADKMWSIFADVAKWPQWNPCMFWAHVTGGKLEVGAHLIWAFNPIEPAYLYRLPAIARIVACEPGRKVTWEVRVPPGFHAQHSYTIEPIDAATCRFGSWEVAEGPMYRLLRPFWLKHFTYVRDASLAGAAKLAETA